LSLRKNEIATPPFGGLAMTNLFVFIARSEATKQSRFYCLFRDCHGFPSESLAMTAGMIATASLQEALQ
jgi:hypothetical protein